MRQRGKASWQLRVFLGADPVTGRRRYLSRTFRGGKREAARALGALVQEAERLSPRAGSQGSLETLCREWLAHATPNLSPRTVDVARGYLERPIISQLGEIPVARLTAAELDRFYRGLLEMGPCGRPYAPATVRRVHGILRRVLAQGVRWGWLAHNPAIDASPPRVPHKVLTPPSPDDVLRLQRLAETGDPPFATFLRLAASSGARRGELLAIRRRDLDLDRAILRIERGIVLADNKLVEQGTKTHQARTVALDTLTVDALRQHLAWQDEIAAACEASVRADAFVFSGEADASVPWRPDAVTRDFGRLCAKARVPGVRLHDLRHYVATRLLSSGVDVRAVAGRLVSFNVS